MINKIKLLLISGVAVIALSGCGSACTEDDLKDKLQELSVKVQGLAASGDVSKLMEFSKKASEISKSMQDGNDIQAACEAADDLLDEL